MSVHHNNIITKLLQWQGQICTVVLCKWHDFFQKSCFYYTK